MLKTRLAVLSLGFAIILPAIFAAHAQTVPPAGPLPSQVLTAKKVFISNIGEGADLRPWSGGPDRLYNEFYAAIKSSGRYEMVAAPADSDLVMEVQVIPNELEWQFHLVLLDPKTHFVLWTLCEPVNIAGLQKTRDKSFDQAVSKLVQDLITLTAQPAAASSPK